MKKVFKLKDLDCANCAAKMERGIIEIEGVESASITFMTAKLIIEADESLMDEIITKAQKIIKKIEPDCRIVR